LTAVNTKKHLETKMLDPFDTFGVFLSLCGYDFKEGKTQNSIKGSIISI